MDCGDAPGLPLSDRQAGRVFTPLAFLSYIS